MTPVAMILQSCTSRKTLAPLAVLLFGAASAGMRAQVSAQSSAAEPASRVVRGQVIDALTGTGIPRALVTANSRQALTDSRGRFQFEQFANTSANISVTRPGFSPSPDSVTQVVVHSVTNFDSDLIVKLYPDAVVSGIVTGSDGLPLGQVQVLLRRATYGAAPRWGVAAFAQTNSRGEYRLVTPGGRFRLSLAYNPRLRETGEALSPLTFPDTPGGTFTLATGEDRRVDLRAHTGNAFPVNLKVDRVDARGGVRFSVTQNDGDGFTPSASGNSNGEYRLELPSGTYLIHAHTESREEANDGFARVTVAGHEVTGVAIHMVPATSLPIEVETESNSSTAISNSAKPISVSNGTIQASQLNLYLRNTSSQVEDGRNQDINLRQREDKTFEFRVPAGSYRLQSRGQGGFSVLSASCGATDLLTTDLIIGPGSAGQTIRVTASNASGRLRGRIALRPGDEDLWAYLFPQRPSLNLPNPVQVGADGTFLSWVPAGSYAVVVLHGQLQEDVQSPEVAARLASGAHIVEVGADTETTVDLEVQRPSEAAP